MDNNPPKGPGSSGTEQDKDSGLNGHKPDTTFIDDLQADAEQHQQAFAKVEQDKLNPFPVNVFPDPIQHIIQSAHEGLAYPVDFTGVSMLYAAALSVGNTHTIEVKKTWFETAIFYFVIVGPPGTYKSHPLTFAVKPIQDRDNRSFREYETLKQVYDQSDTSNKNERTQNGINSPIKPIWVKCLIDDHTPEALAEKHKFNKRGVGICCDELAGWLNNFNRYHKGGQQEFWLSAWGGKPINIDRKTSEPIYITRSFIPVIGTIQTGILDKLSQEGRNQNGFIERLLFAMPDNLKKEHWSDTEMDTQVVENWERIVYKLLDLPLHLDDNHNPKPTILNLTDEAKTEFTKWFNDIADLINLTDDEAIKSIYAKADMKFARFALILEMMYWACDESDKQAVGIKSVKGAIQLVEYFHKTAIKVHRIISDPLERLPFNKRNLYEALPDSFTTGEGLLLAKQCEVSDRTAKRFFMDEKGLFDRVRMGQYEKRL